MTMIRLVMGVARLGEADLQAWWSSQGLNPAVEFALSGFRRTKQVVGAELALLSATRRHAQVLPRENAVHLFSPHLQVAGWTRAYLAELKSAEPSELVSELRAWRDVDTAINTLSNWCDAVEVARDERSAVTRDDLSSDEVSAALVVGFVTDYLTMPSTFDVPYVDLAT